MGTSRRPPFLDAPPSHGHRGAGAGEHSGQGGCGAGPSLRGAQVAGAGCRSMTAQPTQVSFQHPDSHFCLQPVFTAPLPRRGEGTPFLSGRGLDSRSACVNQPIKCGCVPTGAACPHLAHGEPGSHGDRGARAALHHWCS